MRYILVALLFFSIGALVGMFINVRVRSFPVVGTLWFDHEENGPSLYSSFGINLEEIQTHEKVIMKVKNVDAK